LLLDEEEDGMQTRVSEIAAGVYRFSTWVAEVAPPSGFTFNQFLIEGDEPMLFHCGMRQLFPLVSEAVARVMPLDRLRWIGFGHVEADECGSMNQWLAAAPDAQVVHGELGCMVSITDLADRAPKPLQDGEVLDLGGKRMRWIATPHVPHAWEAGVFFEETAKTLFCGDLLSHLGEGPPLTDADILGPALEAERNFRAMTMAPGTPATLRRLAELAPTTLAVMHGSSLRGDAPAALEGLASFCERESAPAMA
jgi:flavorubredoxin